MANAVAIHRVCGVQFDAMDSIQRHRQHSSKVDRVSILANAQPLTNYSTILDTTTSPARGLTGHQW